MGCYCCCADYWRVEPYRRYYYQSLPGSGAQSRGWPPRKAVTDTKIEELTCEVRAHNTFAQRVPVLEEQIKVANHRITDLENKTA